MNQAKPFYYIANWKMNMTRAAVQQFCDALQQASELKTAQIIICPSFIHIPLVAKELEKTPYAYGAQDCSPFAQGAHTGQVSAASLAEFGCKYTIIGHSELRSYCQETNALIGQKAAQLLACGINPIICIGETSLDYQMGKTFEALSRQLEPLLKLASEAVSAKPHLKLFIAYEPIWAIGSKKIPEIAYLEQLFDWLRQTTAPLSKQYNLAYVYGGSVDQTTAPTLKELKQLDGFLIGGASLDFQKFKNIVV